VVEKASRQLTTCTDVCGLRNLLFGSSESMAVAVRQTGPADEYTGALLFDTTSKAAQVSVPVVVKIREGPFFPKSRTGASGRRSSASAPPNPRTVCPG
jgi:hypothetical protein